MIDHLLWHADKASALANTALSRWIHNTEDGPAWDESRVFADVKLVVSAEPYACLPGYWIIIASRRSEPREDLVDMNEHKLAASREMAIAGWPFVFADGMRADPQVMAQVIRIDGVPSGSDYPGSAPAVIA